MSLLVLGQVQPSASTNAVLAPTWNWAELVNLTIDKGALKLSLGPIVLLVLCIGVAAYCFWRFRLQNARLPRYEVVEASLKVANIGEIKLRPNHENIRIAYQSWIELTTRKVALPFNEEHDVIAEVYSSFYEIFGRLRELAKSIPAARLRESEDTRKLVEVMVKVLNEGLRPHLTVWQSKFKWWYATELERPESKMLTPQQIQKKYPEYKALVLDLKKVHDEVVEYGVFYCGSRRAIGNSPL